GITVTGTGEVTGTPDTVEVSLGVAVLAETVQEATTTAAQKADALISALTDGGVDRKDITTTDYSIYPEYDYSTNKELLVGYRVSNTVRVKIRNVDDTGSLIDAATAAGGDDVRVSGLQFSIDDDADLLKPPAPPPGTTRSPRPPNSPSCPDKSWDRRSRSMKP
ncbi:MAG: SIMPL domain-containing protein, partial [Acidimicrobiia bacterium]